MLYEVITVMAERPFLVDTGRFGQGGKLLGMIEAAGLSAEDFEFVLISHGHEDHDGGLAELVETRITSYNVCYTKLLRKFRKGS